MQPQRRPPTTTLAFHASRIVIDVGVLLAMASMSLDFVSSPSGGRSALALDALPAVLLLLPIFGVTLIPDHTRPLPRPVAWVALVLGLAAFPYAIVKHLDASVLADSLGGSVALGARLLVFGAFVTVVGIGVGLTRTVLGLPTGGAPAASKGARAPRRRKAQEDPPPQTATQKTPMVSKLPPADEGARRAPGAPSGAQAAPAAEPARPARSEPEKSPFGEPLFDSLEIPAFVKDPDDRPEDEDPRDG